jgi:predicted transcriptional regulator
MSPRFKTLLQELAERKIAGPSATLTSIHLALALDTIGRNAVGRAKLAQDLKMGEGATRTIIKRLKNARLIQTSIAGLALTSEGHDVWKEFTSNFRETSIESNELSNSPCNNAVLVKHQATKVKSGMEQRDAAIMTGARNATTILCSKGRLVIPSISENVKRDFPEAGKMIIRLLSPEDGDVIIVSGAESCEKARYGAFAAAWTLA